MFCLVGVELRGLEPLTPCLQIAVIGLLAVSELVVSLAMGGLWVPLVTGANGTLMARRFLGHTAAGSGLSPRCSASLRYHPRP